MESSEPIAHVVQAGLTQRKEPSKKEVGFMNPI